jgi:predicted DNA-binding transcriptional regulator AlpA
VPQFPQAGGRTATTTIGIAHVAPGVNAPADGDITPELLTLADAAKLLSVSPSTLTRWSKTRLAPTPLKLGSGKQGASRYARREILAWIASGSKAIDGRYK